LLSIKSSVRRKLENSVVENHLWNGICGIFVLFFSPRERKSIKREKMNMLSTQELEGRTEKFLGKKCEWNVGESRKSVKANFLSLN
jgi:hypothetical protein